jgi:hypothetical protein
MFRMQSLKLIAATTAAIGALAAVTPIANAETQALPALANPGTNVCQQIALEGPWAVLGPYGVLGDYGPLGSKAKQKNPASECSSQSVAGGMGMLGIPGGMVGF